MPNVLAWFWPAVNIVFDGSVMNTVLVPAAKLTKAFELDEDNTLSLEIVVGEANVPIPTSHAPLVVSSIQ